MIAPVAVLDASVLYPSLIRNLLLHLATHGLIAARWTDAIHDEWIRNLLMDRPDLTSERLERTRRLMEEAVPDASITAYERLVPGLVLPDPDDRHVLAAAIMVGATLVVTSNLDDFPAEALGPHNIQALSPDTLLCRLLEERRQETIAAVEAMRVTLRKPAYTWDGLMVRLREVGLSGAALMQSEL